MAEVTVGRNEDGSLDEVFIRYPVSFHIEQMDTNYWWIGVVTSDGKDHHINLTTTRAAITATYEEDA